MYLRTHASACADIIRVDGVTSQALRIGAGVVTLRVRVRQYVTQIIPVYVPRSGVGQVRRAHIRLPDLDVITLHRRHFEQIRLVHIVALVEENALLAPAQVARVDVASQLAARVEIAEAVTLLADQ